MSDPPATDPLAEVVTLLQPKAGFSKPVGARGPWRIRRGETGQPIYFVVLTGTCLLTLSDRPDPITLIEGDFILVPAMRGATFRSLGPTPPDAPDAVPTLLPSGEYRFGPTEGPPEVQWLVGDFSLGSPDAALVMSLLPQVIQVRGQPRLTTLVQLVIDESRDQRPARDVILSRLLEVLLVEALRSTTTTASPGLLRGLTDDRLATAIRAMHETPQHPWTVAELAAKSALSRSAFFARFTGAVGMAPMEYLQAWRMALGKSLLRNNQGVAAVAARLGYGSASAFSTAFARHVGMPPARFARDEQPIPDSPSGYERATA